MNRVVERINELRIKSGLSKVALAKKIGVSANTIGNWSKTDSMPTLAVIERICEVTNVTLEQFFCGIDCGVDTGLTDRFLDEWRVLSETEKVAIEKVIDAFNELK